ncbi:transposase, partial [Lactiplantibacillus plantarum]|nr:transposase [Lactiplantibacillus plantarum]
MMVWDWERRLIEGHLKPSKGRSLKMTDKSKQSKTLKQLQEENELLRIRVAYLEKL